MYENEKNINIRLLNLSKALQNKLAFRALDDIDYGHYGITFTTELLTNNLSSNEKINIK